MYIVTIAEPLRPFPSTVIGFGAVNQHHHRLKLSSPLSSPALPFATIGGSKVRKGGLPWPLPSCLAVVVEVTGASSAPLADAVGSGGRGRDKVVGMAVG